jgi:tetratricopeptide (TPR) repeat protein
MSIIEQTLNRLDAGIQKTNQDDQDDRQFIPGFTMRRRASLSKWFVLALLALALGGAGFWWSTRMAAPDLSIAKAAKGSVATANPTPSAVPARVEPVPEPLRAEPQAAAALPIVRPSPAVAAEQVPSLAKVAGAGDTRAYLDAAPPWLVRGMGLYLRGDREDAKAVWMEGVAALPGHHMLLALPLVSSEAAVRQNMVDLATRYPVMLLATKKDGKLVNQLFSYVDGKENMLLADALSKQLGADSLQWISAAALRLRLPERPLDGAAAAAAPVKNRTPVAKEAAPRRPAGSALKEASRPAPLIPAAPLAAMPAAQAETLISEPPAMLERAEKMINADQSVEALFELRNAKGRQLEDWRYHYLVGVAEMKLGRKTKAQDALSLSIRINPNQSEPRLKRAVLLQDAGQHNDAMADLRAAEKLAPLTPEIHLNIGYSTDALGRTAEAKAAYLRFLSLSQAKASYSSSREWVSKRVRDLNGEGF